MKKIISAALAATLTLSVAGCYTPGDRAVGGAALGGLAGAAIGGAAVGAAGGAIVGAATAPRGCPPGTFLAADGACYPY